MKTIFYRAFLFLIATSLGSLVFILLAYTGDKTKGPLDDLLLLLNTRIARLEKSATDFRDSRASSLKWFDQYRNSPVVLNKTDILIIGAYDDNTVESYESIIALEDSLQTRLPVISLYTAWGSKKSQVFPTLRAQAIYDLGSMPMITWEPWLDDFDPSAFPVNPNAANKNKGGLRAVANGKFDAYIDKWATDAKLFRHPFFLRLAHEMNDPYRYPWGPQNNAPEDFIAAWKHIRERFNKAGARNVVWIWSPHPAYPSNEFYPGEAYVDWVGTTTINYGTVAPWSQWWSFDDIFNKFYTEMLPHKKPIILTEFSSLEVGGNRPEWFQKALHSLNTKYSEVKALIFFHVVNDNTTTYKTLDWSFKNDRKVVAIIRNYLQKESTMKE